MRSHAFLLAAGLALAASGAQSAVIYDFSPVPMPVFHDLDHNLPEQMTAVPGGGYDHFGLGRGSLAPYNTFLTGRDGKRAGSRSGINLASMRITGAQTSWTSNRHVNFHFALGDQHGSVMLAGNDYALESRNRAYARLLVPEPATLALLALGLVGLWVSRHQVHTR